MGFADFRGSRQYITIGNASANDRVSLFLMDYPNRRRLKILGRLRVIEADIDNELAVRLKIADYAAVVERSMLIEVEAFDWNCAQHIIPSFAEKEVAAAFESSSMNGNAELRPDVQRTS
jgi:uncharacterized protein